MPRSAQRPPFAPPPPPLICAALMASPRRDCAPSTWRVDPGGELHAFDRDALWSVCRLMCASLTSEESDSTHFLSVCSHCAARRSGPGAQLVPLDAIGRRAVGEPARLQRRAR